MKTVEKFERFLKERLRTARKQAGMTQAELSERSGVAQQSISELEADKRPMGMKTARRLAARLPDTNAGEILIGNRLGMYKRAKKAGDRRGAIVAVKGLLEAVGDEEMTQAGELFLDELADGCLAFVSAAVASRKFQTCGDGERYEAPAAEAEAPRQGTHTSSGPGPTRISPPQRRDPATCAM